MQGLKMVYRGYAILSYKISRDLLGVQFTGMHPSHYMVLSTTPQRNRNLQRKSMKIRVLLTSADIWGSRYMSSGGFFKAHKVKKADTIQQTRRMRKTARVQNLSQTLESLMPEANPNELN